MVLGEVTVVFTTIRFRDLDWKETLFCTYYGYFPLVASFIAARYSQVHGIVFALSYAIILPASGALGHYINGVLGGVRDFVGISGALVIFKVYFSIGGTLIMIGALFGAIFSIKKP